MLDSVLTEITDGVAVITIRPEARNAVDRTVDAQEGARAFAENRKPVWRGE